MYAVTGCIKLNGEMSLIIRQTTININKHLNNPYRAPRVVSTTFTKPIVLSFSIKRLINHTIKNNRSTVVTNAIIFTKKLAYADEMISARVLDE